MDKILKILFLAIVLLTFVNCSKVPAGHVGIKVYLLGGDKGVDHEILGVGRYWIGINEDLFLFPTFQQNYVWTMDKREGSPVDESFTFQTNEGLSVNADIGISYHLREDKIPSIFQKYRRGVEEITDVFMRNQIRDAFNSVASKYKVEYVYGAGKAELIKEVESTVAKELSESGILVDKIYYVSSIRLPPTVVTALNSKIEATQSAQRVKNEVAQTKAEAEKRIINAKAESEANEILSKSINSSLIEWRRIELEEKAIEKWNGTLPQTMLPESSLPFINLQ